MSAMRNFVTAAVFSLLFGGCIDKGDTAVGEEEEQEVQSSSLCAQFCRRVEAVGCGAHSNCEVNCIANAEVCPDEVDIATECAADEDNDLHCDAQGDPQSDDCQGDFDVLGVCLAFGGSEAQSNAVSCEEDSGDCQTCCEDAFPDGEAEWSAVLEECVAETCGQPCDGVAGNDNATVTEACSTCAIDCVRDTCLFGETLCGAYMQCTSQCPADTSEPEPPALVELPASPNLGVALRRWAEVQCATETRCNYLLVNIVAGNEEYCIEQVQAGNDYKASLPGNAFTAEKADECAERLVNMTCDEWHGPDSDCWLAGELDDGNPCTDNTQCESAWCEAPLHGCGVCGPRPEEGTSCTENAQCPYGICRDGSCVPLGREGQACDDEGPCYGTFLTCLDGICVANDQPLGDNCGPQNGLPYCDQVTANLLCTSNGICEEATVAEAGDPCPALGWCEGSGRCEEGVCVAGPGEGDECSDEMGLFCRWPLACRDGACVGRQEPYECE